MSDGHTEVARELRAFLRGTSSVALISGGTARARTHLTTEAIETTRRWLRVSKPAREQARLALDLIHDGTVLLDGIDGADAMEVAERAIREAHAGSRRRVILSGLSADLGRDLPVTRIRLPRTPMLIPRDRTMMPESLHARPAAR